MRKQSDSFPNVLVKKSGTANRRSGAKWPFLRQENAQHFFRVQAAKIRFWRARVAYHFSAFPSVSHQPLFCFKQRDERLDSNAAGRWAPPRRLSPPHAPASPSNASDTSISAGSVSNPNPSCSSSAGEAAGDVALALRGRAAVVFLCVGARLPRLSLALALRVLRRALLDVSSPSLLRQLGLGLGLLLLRVALAALAKVTAASRGAATNARGVSGSGSRRE